MATGDVKVTEGLGKNVAVYTFSEDAETKVLQRVALADQTGADVMGQVTGSPTTNTLLDRLKTIGTNTAAATPTGGNVIGKVGVDQTTEGSTNRAVVGKTTVVPVTLSLDTSAYASGDLLADTQVITNATRVNDFGAILQSLVVTDKDDQGVGFDVWILESNISFGTENSPPTITDTDAVNIIGRISVTAADYYDLGGCKVAAFSGLGIPVIPASGTRNCYVAVVNGTGAPTFTASGVVLNFGFLQD